MKQLVLIKKSGIVEGFHVKPGFVVMVDDDEVVAITSGWECNGQLFVYRPSADGWEGNWETDETFPVEYVLEIIDEYQRKADFKKAVKEAKEKAAKGEKLLYSDKTITIVQQKAGEKCHDGGEYGFWTDYIPSSVPGVYKVVSHTTCDFDPCGTGYEGYTALTEKEYSEMLEAVKQNG